MRTRFALGFFILGVVLLTVDPLAGQPGGGKLGRGAFGGFGPPTGGQPGTTPMAPGAVPMPPGAFQVQPGGLPMPPGGGRPGGGRNPFDPENQWATLLQQTGGTDAIDFGRLPPETRAMSKMAADRFGTVPYPDAGVMTKSQFLDFATRNQELVRAKMSGGAPPVPGQPGGPPQMMMQVGGPRGGMTDEEAVRRFRERDRDQDGRLTYEEASDTTRQNWADADANRDNVVDLDEYRAYIARRFGPGAQPGAYPMPPAGDFRGTSETGGSPGSDRRREEKKDDFSTVAIRFGKLPPGLPDWFTEYDTDKDGQVNMYEWRTAGGKTVAEFRELDANGDGLIAPLELIRLTAVRAETDRLLAIQDGDLPQGAGKGGSPSGKGGSMSGKGGGPGAFMTGKGGPPAAGGDARPTREEKREEKGAPNPFRSFGGKK